MLLDAKLTPPPVRPGIVPRSALVERIRDHPARVVTMVAPPGYGKSTLLRQVAESSAGSVAWVSLDSTDNDPTVFVSSVAAAIDRSGRRSDTVMVPNVRPMAGAAVEALARLVGSVMEPRTPSLLALDDLHEVSHPEVLDAITWLAEHLPGGLRLVVTSRAMPGLPLPRLRARGQLLEIGLRDLAFDAAEVGRILHDAGLDLPRDSIAELTDRCEGWPAAVHLASLSLRTDATRPLARWPGDDRFLAEYVRSEMLDQLDPSDRRFLRQVSVLDRMNGSLADAVTRSHGGSATLARLARANQFLVPLDGGGDWYRCHHLLREVLAAERDVDPPRELATLRRRASEWHQGNGDIELAVEYAHDAGDLEQVAALLERNALQIHRRGQIATLDRWFDWFDDVALLEQHPPLALLGSMVFALVGRTTRAERWADAAAAGTWSGERLPDGSTDIDGWRSMLEGMLCRRGLAVMRADAERSLRLIHPASALRGMAMLLEGWIHLLDDQSNLADQVLANSVDVSIETGGLPAAITALGFRASLAARRGDWPAASVHHETGVRLIAEHRFETYSTSALVTAVGARLAMRRGHAEQARRDLGALQRMRPMLTAAVPVLSTTVRMEMARAHLATGDIGGARTVLRETADILIQRPSLGILPMQHAALARQVAVGAGAPGATTLTTAELRLLAYLPSHLTFREIAARLFVSPNTVKTQAIAVYGKLGVSSRGGAIEAAVHAGLLDASLVRLPDDLMHTG